MDIVYVLMISEDGEREVYGIYKTWSAAYEVSKNLENQEKYDSVEIEIWAVNDKYSKKEKKVHGSTTNF